MKGDQDSTRLVGQYPKMDLMPDATVAAIAAFANKRLSEVNFSD